MFLKGSFVVRSETLALHYYSFLKKSVVILICSVWKVQIVYKESSFFVCVCVMFVCGIILGN